MGGEDGCDGIVGIYTVFCVPDSDDVKQRTTTMKQYQADCPWTENKEVFWATSSVSSAWNADWNLESINIWTKCQFIWSGKVCIWLWQPFVSTSSCMLRIEKLITFNMICMWTFHTLQIYSCMVFVSRACTQITVNTFIDDLVLFTGIIQC